MAGDSSDDLQARVEAGDEAALSRLFDHYRQRLRAMVDLRMDRRVRGRLDASDVLQDAYLEATERYSRYVEDPSMPFYLWLRFITGQRLLQLHRKHLGTHMRDAAREISLQGGAMPAAVSDSFVDHLVGSFTSPSEAFAQQELRERMQRSLDALAPLDREILALRHFEELTNDEVTLVLGITKAAASNRYVRALQRLQQHLGPGLRPEDLT